MKTAAALVLSLLCALPASAALESDTAGAAKDLKERQAKIAVERAKVRAAIGKASGKTAISNAITAATDNIEDALRQSALDREESRKIGEVLGESFDWLSSDEAADAPVLALPSADVTQLLQERAAANYEFLKDTLNGARLLGAPLDLQQTLSEAVSATKLPLRLVTENAAHLTAQYGLYAGPSFSLAADGSWNPGYELLMRFDPKAVRSREAFFCARVFAWCKGYAEVSYQTLGAVEKLSEAATEGGEDLFNPFLEDSGYLRINSGFRMHVSNWWGFRFGAGLSSVPNTEKLTRLERRWFAGLDFETIYDDGALGQLFIGYANDHFWQYGEEGQGLQQEYDRYVFDSVLMLPSRKYIGFQTAARLYADSPVSGRGPSEVRVSLLAYVSFNNWLSMFNPLMEK